MENLELCKACKGSCCKTMGCHYSPEDFKDLSFEGLKREIEKGHISIDYWEGNPFEDSREIRQAYYLRVRNVNSNVVDASWGGTCSLLTDSGCPLTYDSRPKGARLLIPGEGRNCIPKYTKQQCAIDWYTYNDVLIELKHHFSSNTEDSDSIIEDFFKALSFMSGTVGVDDINEISKKLSSDKN